MMQGINDSNSKGVVYPSAMRIFVTGGKGFIGRELKSYLQSLHHEVESPGRSDLDLTDPQALKKFLNRFKPNHIYHLAGISRVNDSLGMPDYFNSNTLTTLSLLTALKDWGDPLSFFFASSMHVYGNQVQEVSETTPPEPLSYYAFTKYLSEQTIQRVAKEMPHFQFVIGRLYSCFGPSQPEGFVTADLIRKTLELKPNSNAVLKTGPLKTFRRFLDVRDVVRVMQQLTEYRHPSNCEVFNLASPFELQIEEILQLILKITQQSPKIESVADTKNAFQGLKVNTNKLFSVVDKKEFRPVESTIRDMIQFAKGRVLHAS